VQLPFYLGFHTKGTRRRTLIIEGVTMIANSANPYPQDVSRPSTLNDLRVQNTVADVPSSASALTLAGVAAAVVLAIGAFVWMDPLHLHLFTPTPTNPPTSTPLSTTNSVEVPTAPARAAQAQQVPTPETQPRAAATKPDSRRNSAAKSNTNTRVAQASTSDMTAPPTLTAPEEKAQPPVLLAKPEEKMDAPVVPKVADGAGNAPKPASADQAPAAE
jgi:hypothetical protein